MTDEQFQAGMVAAMQAYYSSLSGGYVVSGLSFSYTPPPATVPPVETVPVPLS